MTKRRLLSITRRVIASYAFAFIIGAVLHMCDAYPSAYAIYRDLLSLIIAMPAAYLAFAFQRRHNYVQALRSYWSVLVRAVRGAYAYSFLESPTQDQYVRTLTDLSIAIDEARGVFENLPAPGNSTGWYPFEPIREVLHDLQRLGHGSSVTEPERLAFRERTETRWKMVRQQLLLEFDRDQPTYHHTAYSGIDRDSSRGV